MTNMGQRHVQTRTLGLVVLAVLVVDLAEVVSAVALAAADLKIYFESFFSGGGSQI